jgi:hypothetical protein
MRGGNGGARDHPLCSFAACVPPKDWSAEDVRCVRDANDGARARDACSVSSKIAKISSRAIGDALAFVFVFARIAPRARWRLAHAGLTDVFSSRVVRRAQDVCG